MIEENYIDLMHKEIDGAISPEEKDELYKYLTGNDEAKNFYRDLMQTANLLKRVPVITPPKDLKAQILESLDWSKYQQKPKRPVSESIQSYFFKPKFKLAYAFAIGIFVGILFYALYFSAVRMEEPLDNSNLYGTIGRYAAKDLKELQVIPIELNNISGNIHLRQVKDLIVFDVNLMSPSTFDLRLEYASPDYRFSGFQQDDSDKVLLKQNLNSIEISTLTDARYLLFFSRKINEKPSPIDLKILQSGQVLAHQSIYVNIF